MPFTSERTRSRHPFETYMLCASAFYSINGLIARQVRPGSVQETIGSTGTAVWLAFVAVGSVAALLGIAWRRPSTGLLLEGLGCFVTGSATLFYVALAFSSVGLAAFAPTAVMLGFGAACLTRAWQLHRVFHRAAKGTSNRSGE